MKIAVAGGGASGIAAAITAARNGAEVTVYEQADRIGKKILASGNGRCNLSNLNMNGSFYNAPDYVDKIYKAVPPTYVTEFFRSVGLVVYAGEEGRIYPVTNQSSAVLDCLRNELDRLNVKVITGTEFNTGHITNKHAFDKIIWAAGSIAGKNGVYVNPLKETGHTSVNAYPSLVPLVTDKKWLKAMNGIRVSARLTFNAFPQSDSQSSILTEEGEVLFRDYGISGIAVFNISAYMARQAAATGRYGGVIEMELLPGLSKAELVKDLRDRLKNITDIPGRFFTGLLNKNLSALICDELGLTHRKINIHDTGPIADLMKGIHINVYKPKGFAEAQVVSGGINLNEVDTVKSKLIENLYITGEALDVDGLCGGYNLHFAWASGILAGMQASKT